ncbi:hypothetical protein GCM10010446_07820 [Streptomyces enissocaesilis]|uniref:Membrane transport protein MMPL domain-containing protein n=1 Tax=Streptomyces enissocaesilis TaxID=332589 RepID=A0ABN3WS87_9ACTN
MREGLAATGKVITAAAAIMIVVFAAFVFSPDRMLQQFGLGLAVTVLLDAVVIRCLIVAAVTRLLGRRAWWLPARLRGALPRVRLGAPLTRHRRLLRERNRHQWDRGPRSGGQASSSEDGGA